MMGVNYTATAFAGVKVQCKTVKKKETRYNEVTGHPYQIDVSSHREVWIGDNLILSEKDMDQQLYDGMPLKDYSSDPLVADLTFFDDERDFYIGAVLAKSDRDESNTFKEFNPKVPVHVRSFADRYKSEVAYVLYLEAD